MQVKKPTEALQAFEASLQKTPNRLNGLYGACTAAYKSGDLDKARKYYMQLDAIAKSLNRPGLEAIKQLQ